MAEQKRVPDFWISESGRAWRLLVAHNRSQSPSKATITVEDPAGMTRSVELAGKETRAIDLNAAAGN